MIPADLEAQLRACADALDKVRAITAICTDHLTEYPDASANMRRIIAILVPEAKP